MNNLLRAIEKAEKKQYPKETATHAAYRLSLETPTDPDNARIRVSRLEDRTYRDGEVFASKLEMERWDYLLKLQQAGMIQNLQKQVSFILIDSFIHDQYGEIKGISYVADFVYFNVSFRKEYKNRSCVEDSKGGVRTDKYKLKRKMFLSKYPDLLFFEV